MRTHAPDNYNCPFCNVQNDPESRAWKRNRNGWVFDHQGVFCIVPTHYWGINKGNVLIIPKQHFENIYTIDENVGVDIIYATKLIAYAMIEVFACDGISTRQHNEPAGNQDIWHFHQHVFPRFSGDNLYSSQKQLYVAEEKTLLAGKLSLAIKRINSNSADE